MNREWRHTLDLIAVLTHQSLRTRYKNNFLGYLWSIAQPLLFALVFYSVFKIIMKVQMEKYGLFVLSGLFSWQTFNYKNFCNMVS